MADDSWTEEQRKYMNSIVGSPYAANVNPFDTSNPGLTGSGGDGSGDVAPSTEGGVELPFRFTQWQLNPGGKAATGQWSREAQGRSPFTSGQLASELSDIQSQLGNLPEMSGPPTAPILPPEPVRATDPAVTMEQGAEGATTPGPDMRWGLPLKVYEVPSGLYGMGRNPVDVARQWEAMKPQLEASGFDMSKLGPMTKVESYDLKSALGDEEYNKWMTGDFQGADNKAQQALYQNLERLPAAFDPQLNDKIHMMNLAQQGFAGERQLAGSPITMSEGQQSGSGRVNATDLLNIFNAAPANGTAWRGSQESSEQYNPYLDYMAQKGLVSLGANQGEGSRPIENTWYTGAFGDQNPLANGQIQAYTLPDGQVLYFTDPNSQYSLGQTQNQEADYIRHALAHNNKESTLDKIAQVAIPGLTFAAMAAMTGGAAGALLAPAGAAGGAAGGAAAGTAGGAAAGTTAGTATGLAGGLGMSAGYGATGVNMLAGLVGNYGLKAAAEMAGLPMDHPLMQAAMAMAGGAAGGIMSSMGGAAGTGTAPILGEDQLGGMSVLPADYYNSVNAPILGSGELGGMSTLPEGYYNGVTPTGVIDMPQGMSSAAYNQLGAQPQPNTNLQKDFGKGVLQTGLKAATVALTPEPQAGGDWSQAGQQTPEYAQYQREYAAYEQAVQQYNQQMEAYMQYQQQLEDRAAEIQRLMSAYEQDSGNWAARQALQSRQTGIQNQIQSSIAGNEAYKRDVQGTGVQGALFR